MPEIFLFKPQVELTAKENLQSFIEKCRSDLTVFGSDLNWSSHVWPKVAVFAKLGVITRKPSLDQLMAEDFRDFAKAYLRYQQGHNPTGTKNELKALRAIEASLVQVNGNSSILGLSITCLDEAASLAKQHYSDGACYQCGREIERLAHFVSTNFLVPAKLNFWRNPIVRPGDTVRTGAEAKAARAKKLPDEIALNALAEIFANQPRDPRDIFTTSVFAMLMSAPSRISEVLALPVDCEVVETDRDGVERYGWRFFSGKGYEGDIKWIPSVMVSVAKTAVQRLRSISADARKLATWIEESPNRFYRHECCPVVSDDTPLTMEQACQALGLAHNDLKACRTSLNNRGLKEIDGAHTLNSLWVHVLSRLPSDFPWFDKEKGIKYSDALFVLNKNQLNGVKGCLPTELHKPDNNFFNNDLSLRESLEGEHRNIFDRHGYVSEHGQRLSLKSHQARHFLNTLAQRGGLSNLEIAKWSGRADVKQNRVYNHMTEYEMVAMAERIDPTKNMFGPVGEAHKNSPVTTQEFNALEQAAVHVTEFGFCVHDYTMSPCEKYRDCINCTEQVCIKGDEANLERIKARLEKTEALLSMAKNAVEEGDVGADRWLTYHQKSVTRLRELVAILDSPEIEKGAQIKLRGNDFTQLRRVAHKKEQLSTKGDTSDNDESLILSHLTEMLGGGFG